MTIESVTSATKYKYMNRFRVKQPFSESIAAFFAIFEGRSEQIALLDLSGVIIAVNRSWRRFGEENGLRPAYESVGKNYLEICRVSRDRGVVTGQKTYAGLLDVINGEKSCFTLTYPCHGATRRWYRIWAQRQTPDVMGIIVAHYNLNPDADVTALRGRFAAHDRGRANSFETAITFHPDTTRSR